MAETLTTAVLLQLPDLGLPSRFLTLPSHLPLSCIPKTLSLTLPPGSFYFVSNGKALPASSNLAAVASSGDLSLRLRARGGGGDGGATGAESRDCYLSMYATKKPDKADPNETRLSRWTTCALSGEPLAPPAVVVDRLGALYNKEALVEALLHRRLPRELRHIRGLRDMIPIHLAEAANADADAEVRFQCPVTGLEFNGKYPFLALRGCGHVLSAKALKEVKTSACLVCHAEFSESNKIVINGTEEEVAALRERMEAEKAEKVKAKEKKEKNGVTSGGKRSENEKGEVLENGKKDGGGGKRFKAVDNAPANATREVYASIFTSSKKSDFKETFTCRSLPLGRN